MNKFDDLGLIVFKTTNDSMESELMKSKLEANNFPVMIKSESFARITVDGLGEIKILIRKEDLEKANKIIDSSRVKHWIN
jgi:hypothetical protein